MNKKITMLALSFVMLAQVSVADKKQERSIFKCTNIKGAVYYNDKPCPVTDKEKKMRAVKDPLNNSVGEALVSAPVPIKTPTFLDMSLMSKDELAEFRKKIKDAEPPTEYELELLKRHDRQIREVFFPNQTDADDRRRAVNEAMHREITEAGNEATEASNKERE